MASYFEIVSLLLKWAPEIKKYIDIGMPIYKTLMTQPTAKPLIAVLQEAGGQLFPELKTPISTVAAAATALFDPHGTEYVQASLNRLQNAGLDEDGAYGALTKAAVLAFQTAHQPASGPMDGWAGPKTKAVIAAELAKLPAV